MIPLKLQIKNFLSYGPEIQTIDFSSYPLICLSGRNGHGKSALLDALTWALWGHARKIAGTSKADHGLLRLGQTQMMVCLDFVCNGQEYRVRREYAQTYGKPYAALDFGLLDSAQDKFVSLTDKTIRETQSKIETMLHLSYDAFINSAFLRQGQSNEFSKKSPRERKDILASILGLDQYELIRKRASEKIKDAQTRKGYAATIQQKIQDELQAEQRITEQLEALSQNYQTLIAEQQIIQQSHQKLMEEKNKIQTAKQELHMIQYKHEQLAQEEEKLQKNLKMTVAQWRSIHKQQLHATDYSALEAQKKNLLEQIKQFQNQLQQQLNCKEQFLKHKEALAKITSEFQEKQQTILASKKISVERLQVEKKHLENEYLLIEKQFLQNESQLLQKKNEHALLKTQWVILKDYASQEKQFDKRKEHYQQWIAQANVIKNELEAADQKYKMVQNEQAPSCPLCEQNLSASRRRFLIKNFDTHILFLHHRLARLSKLIKGIKVVLIEQHAHLEQFKKEKQEQEKRISLSEELTKVIQKLEAEHTEFAAQKIKLTELITIVSATFAAEQTSLQNWINNAHNELTQQESFQKIQDALLPLQKELETHNYDAKKHEQVIQQLADIESMIESFKILQQEIHSQARRAHEVHQLCNQLKELKKAQLISCAAIKKYDDLPTQINILEQQERSIITSANQLAQQKEQLLQEKGTLEAFKAKLNQLHVEFEKQKQELIACDKTIDDYQAIALATSKDGIQALLIEDAIPEIEQETNDLLAKLTDNQTQLFIESLRDLKKGGTKETLDIKISDAMGIRPYELFSGGEAFRIDFALRIAISKLLARRSGTSLQTLIIDEGFGSQDEEGLSHIMEALYKIQEDFSKIIIVSHLHSMKNQFPVHFLVEKGPNGSMVNVFEQG